MERTRADGFLSRKFGPPVMDHKDVINALTESGFLVREVLQNGEDSVVIASRR